MTNRHLSNLRAGVLLLAFLGASTAANAEALSTTSGGLGVRTLNFTKAKSDKVLTEETEAESQSDIETLNDPVLCQRVSTPSSLGLELGAGGCVHGGGYRTFAHSISSHLQLIYYLFASRSVIDHDDSVRMRRTFFGDLYLIGQGGFAKVTHDQSRDTVVTLSTDVVEFGGGLGWSYRVMGNVAVGVEGTYLVGSIMSRATTGTTSMMLATGQITVFL